MIIKQKAVQTIHELSTLTDFQKIELQNQQTTATINFYFSVLLVL